MRNRVNRLVLGTTAAAVIAIAAAFVLFPVRAEIGEAAGLVYWTVLTLLASAMPVVLPRGTVVSVSAAVPMMWKSPPPLWLAVLSLTLD